MNIAIVDYGLGNIFSIQRAIAFLGYEAKITGNADEIKKADRIILPGVGAFGDGMKELKAKGLNEVLSECVKQGKYILGVCLGMQLLMSSSEEFGFNEGLNFIAGPVKKFPEPTPSGLQYKIPHVGWSQIFMNQDQNKRGILAQNQPGDYMYFVHSFRALPVAAEHILAISVYGGVEFCSAVRKDNIYGMQFHPELSAQAGLKIYQSFFKGK